MKSHKIGLVATPHEYSEWKRYRRLHGITFQELLHTAVELLISSHHQWRPEPPPVSNDSEGETFAGYDRPKVEQALRDAGFGDLGER